MAGCCGCKALYFNVYTNHILTEQFVVETACGLFEPTKHVFKTGSKGEVLSYKSFVAVTDSTYTIPLTKLEKDAFKKLDSIYSSSWHAANRKIVFANISGFKDGGEPHFPVGVKMSKQLKYSR